MSENNDPERLKQLAESRRIWDGAAASFDDEPDHGLRDPQILAAWTALLKTSLPALKGAALDIGCGTGSISLILAQMGCEVTGIDLSPAMIALARKKAARSGYPIQFEEMDAAFPQFPPQQFDAIVCRHVLWALPEVDCVLSRWVRLLKLGGRLLLVEGYWFTGAGLKAENLVAAFPAVLSNIVVNNLSDQADLWGHPVTDERYAITADYQPMPHEH